MDTTLVKKTIDVFDTPTGQMVDVLYTTSDGKAYLTPEEAVKNIEKLEDKRIIPIYRDEKVRKVAQMYTDLERVINATDFLKRFKAIGKPVPIYDEYTLYSRKYGIEPVPNGIYSFIASKVYSTKRAIVVGEKDMILTWKYGIVNATFLYRYPQGQVFSYDDRLIFTCPTNTELVSGDYKDIFKDFF